MIQIQKRWTTATHIQYADQPRSQNTQVCRCDYYETVEEKRRLPHLVMEYIEGDNLEDVITKNQKRFCLKNHRAVSGECRSRSQRYFALARLHSPFNHRSFIETSSLPIYWFYKMVHWHSLILGLP